MKALIFDKSKTDWESTKGFDMVDISKPELGVGDEDHIILKVNYAGVCGTGAGECAGAGGRGGGRGGRAGDPSGRA